ncbi:alpha-glucosidase [Spirochaeta isovalerica]|uniref:Alpha-glucosidase n=1 Tax=Spirochaeta isovalerica TaxID=150 RepID=A0A841R6X0_9SPIO|nr:alpha-glucosidase [Spirochaeta isovalerica]MBB6478729.1 alpha-glucosidase [Spirochaeta isovalerica]
MEWWKEKVIYQIYPRSFADSNNDGIGDLKGITGKLDYLKELGIGGIWLSPHYPSPFLDCGYDVSDYTAVGEEYGSINDFIEFLDEAHKRDIKVILDLVLNHTSDKHRWFEESRSSKDNPKRDWYIWKENKGDFPNDWQSCFNGSAWTLDEKTNEYYYHFFLKEQPDLNWRNPEVKKAMFDAMRFWLDLGVDGFRIDAITAVFEDENLTNQGMTPEEFKKKTENSEVGGFLQENIWEHYMRYQIKQPELHQLLLEIRQLAESYGPDRFLVGELPDTEYLGPTGNELHMVFNFPLMYEGMAGNTVLENQRKRLPLHPEGSWQGNTLSNHDQSRIRSKYASDEIKHPILKQAVFLMMTLKGTPFIYYGEELGMHDYSPARVEDFKDLKSANLYFEEISAGTPAEDALEIARQDTRDRCRTPMPWNRKPNGGFSSPDVDTWLPVDPEYLEGINVDDEKNDPASLWNFYKSIINFRNNHKVLQYGEYSGVETDNDNLLVFKRTLEEEIYYVIINYSEKGILWNTPAGIKTEIIFGSERDYFENIVSGGASIILKVVV